VNNRASVDPRLSLVADLVRDGACFADIGTDHAYLPLYLLSEGRIRAAVAADVAEGPLERARANVRAAGREGEVTLLLADGLTGMEGLGLSDIAICGMGGELIASILEAAPFVRDPAVRLILQPMTRADSLRRYLAFAGFSILAERYTEAAGRVYLCLCVAFDGVSRRIDDIAAVLGDPTARDERDREAFLAFLDLREREAAARLLGKREGGADATLEEDLLAAIAAERSRIL
jgi:tRNA (adenine22-N1)-methyltransferase